MYFILNFHNTYAVIEKCCNKILIGKTFWKEVALPSILMENQVANLNLVQVNELQIIENEVYRKILGAAHGTVLETMRGDKSFINGKQNYGKQDIICKEHQRRK